jgi:hypothetical protein
MDISKCGYLDASMNYSDTEGRAKIATLRFEKNSDIFAKPRKTEINMKDFDLKAAKAGAAVCTRNGAHVEIILYNGRTDGFPILAYVGSSARVRSFKGNGQYRPKYKSESDLMMRDDDYAEKLARGEFGKHIDEATETDREYWRRVYAGQVMSILVDVVVREGRHVVKSGIGIADAVAEDSLKYADALLAKLDKKK